MPELVRAKRRGRTHIIVERRFARNFAITACGMAYSAQKLAALRNAPPFPVGEAFHARADEAAMEAGISAGMFCGNCLRAVT